jgi:ribonuclease BN (tRNA processing enzyme)
MNVMGCGSMVMSNASILKAALLAFTSSAALLAASAIPGPANAAQTSTASKFVTLGTSSGPNTNSRRAQPANYVRYGDTTLLVDAGDGVSEQLGKAGISFEEIDAVLVSHLHFDHTGGLFAFLGRRYQTRVFSKLTVYGPPGTKGTVDGIIAAMMPMADTRDMLASLTGKDPGDDIKVVELVQGSKFSVGRIAVTAAVNTHYILSDKHGKKAQSLSFRFDMPDRSIVYTGDTGPSSNVEALAKNVDVLICEIMDPDTSLARLKKSRPDVPALAFKAVENHFRQQHMSPREVGLMAKRSGAKSLVLTHIALEDDELADARKRIAESFGGPVRFAEDLESL